MCGAGGRITCTHFRAGPPRCCFLADEEEAAAALCEPRDRRLLDTRAARVLRLEDGVVLAARRAGVVAYMVVLVLDMVLPAGL
jgi:hypothetical protein